MDIHEKSENLGTRLISVKSILKNWLVGVDSTPHVGNRVNLSHFFCPRRHIYQDMAIAAVLTLEKKCTGIEKWFIKVKTKTDAII
jgi:hypothetical protein